MSTSPANCRLILTKMMSHVREKLPSAQLRVIRLSDLEASFMRFILETNAQGLDPEDIERLGFGIIKKDLGI